MFYFICLAFCNLYQVESQDFQYAITHQKSPIYLNNSLSELCLEKEKISFGCQFIN